MPGSGREAHTCSATLSSRVRSPCSVQLVQRGPHTMPLSALCAGSGAVGSLSGTGSEESVRLGVANFTDVMLRGTINQTYQLHVRGNRVGLPTALHTVCVISWSNAGEHHHCQKAGRNEALNGRQHRFHA